MTEDYEKVARVIERASELIASDSGWVSGYLATDANGYSTLPYSLTAERFCGDGALSRAVWCEVGLPLCTKSDISDGSLAFKSDDKWLDFWRLYDQVMECVRRANNGVFIRYTNDTEGREAVVLLFKEALAELESMSV